MKNYTNPDIEITEVKGTDIITTSPGTETPKHEEDNGIWDLTIG